ncbi:translocation/assembly module TamB domain-containing protein [Psychroflexus aestuariivivens]|uniref:translocation/assembly module TamB domain-containing protein n=1 Tax=Psychroflexus aestuariivivens TaxID=1795040 RepID=UPI001F0287DE|nr:translocation/assembly module TamB domain-containing protein [Psychroflexus aestuariivivens]
MLLIVLVFSIPQVQSYFANKLTTNLNETYNTKISVDGIKVNFKGQVELENVFIQDDYNDTIIYANSLSTSLVNLSEFADNTYNFSNAEFEGLKFKLKQYKFEEDDSFSAFLNKFEDTTKVSKPFELYIDRVLAINSRVIIEDENKTEQRTFDIDELDFNISDFKIIGTEVDLQVQRLSGILQEGLVIEDFTSKFNYTRSSMSFENLQIETPNSKLNGKIDLSYERKDLKDFTDKVNIKASFENAKISSSDLRRFYDGFGFGQDFVLSSDFSGTLNNLTLSNLDINGISKSKIEGGLTLNNMFGESDFNLDGDRFSVTTNYEDLVSLLPRDLGTNLPEFISKFGMMTLTGRAKVSENDLSLNMLASTEIGQSKLKINFQNFKDPESVTYQGDLRFDNFNIKSFFSENILGKTAFNLKVDGKGFTKESLNTQVAGQIKSIEINNYEYKNIEINGNLKAPYFKGDLKSNDPNFLFDFKGLVDASSEQNVYDFEADIEYSNLKALNIVTRDSLADFKGNVKVDLVGNEIDQMRGDIVFNNFEYNNEKEKFNFEELQISSKFDEEIHTISINSPDIISGSLVGDYKISELPKLFFNAVENLYFRSEETDKTNYQYVDFDINIYNKIVEVFFPDIEVAPNTFMRGSIVASENDFKLNFKSPSIGAYDNKFENVNIQIDTKSSLYNSYAEIEKIHTSAYDISDFNMINVNLKDTLFVRTEFKGGDNNQDKFNLSLYQTANENDKSTFGFKRSSIVYKDNLWFINKNSNKRNKVKIERGFQNFEIDSILLSHNDQFIKLNGELRDSTYKDVNLKFEEVDLAKITPNIDSLNINGVLDGVLNIYQENNLYNPNFDATVKDLKLNDQDYGNLNLLADGNEDLSNFSLKALLKKDNKELFKAEGEIRSQNQNQFFDMNVAFKDFNILPFSGFGEDVVSNIRGLVSGNVDVSGQINDPEFDGELNLDKAGLNVPYLNIDYDFAENSKVKFNRKEFVFDNIEIIDTKYETKGILSGSITNQAFSKWNLDLNISSDNLLALDTKFEDGALYYGTAFIDGNAQISGPTDELVIDVEARTQENTVFKIPLDDSETLGDNSFVYFLSLEDKLRQEEGNQIRIKDVKGVSLNFNLDITRDAEVEIVVDQINGSSLKGRGAGTLLIEINTNGKFNMYGDFVAYEGEYNFKYSGLVQKKFQVVPGSNLTWNGDPVRANIDVQAKYVTEANPSILLENPSINREIPVEVMINLNGQIIQPDITFDLNYPNLSSVVKSELEYRVQGRENTELQALSLVTQGTFYSQAGIGQNAITGNLIERASGIVDDIIKDEDNKFKLGLNYQQNDRTLNQNNMADRVGLSIKTQISERILINGKFGVPVGGVTESVIFGDVVVNFLLNETGSLRANVFNRESDIQFIGEELGYTQGIGLTYTVDFDTFKELINKILNKEFEKQEKGREEEEQRAEPSKQPDYIIFPNEKKGFN